MDGFPSGPANFAAPFPARHRIYVQRLESFAKCGQYGSRSAKCRSLIPIMTLDWPRRLREFGVFGAAGLFLAFINPFNSTGSADFWLRALYWIGLVMLGSYSAEAARALLDRLRPGSHLMVILAVTSISAAIGVTAALMLIELGLNGRALPLRYLPRLFGPVLVISIAMTGIGYMADRSILAPPPTDAPEGAGPVETFLSRLPLKFRQADLYAVSSEDHYLRIHTSLGEELILMRLADALRELETAGGLQVHRSWWVSKAAIRDVKRSGGKVFLVLASGKEVPVSRTYQAEAKAAGLI